MLSLDLSGHTALVTGGSGALGRAMVRTLAEAVSIRSTDLSGSWRPERYRSESSTAARTAASVIWTTWWSS